MSQKTNITLSIDKNLKSKAQKVAKDAGTNLSSLVNMFFAHVANTGDISLSLKKKEWVSLGLEKNISFDEFSQLLDE